MNALSRSHTRPARTLTSLGVLFIACAGHAQPVSQPERAEDLAARALSRDALSDFKLAPSPSEADYRVVAHLLGIAVALSPREEILLRWYVEALTGANEPDRAVEATRALVALDPADTVAQLRLITGRIAGLQSVEERLLAYDRFLGADGEQIDASIRSRLAFDAALLWRERGDLERFAALLTQATELDPTNKDAATLALSFYAERVADPAGRLDLLLGVLYADPFDPAVHAAIARELANAGAYKGADRFLKTLSLLDQQNGIVPGWDERTLRDTVEWNLTGAETLARRLSDQIDDDRKEVLRRRQAASVSRQSADDLPAPEDIRLSISSERTRLLAATASGQKEVAATAMAELAETARRMAQQLADPSRRPREIAEEEVRPRIQQILSEIVWLRLWTGQQLDEATTGLAVLHKNQDLDPAFIRRLDAWLLLRRGDLDAAHAALAELAPTDPNAELGLATLAERRGDKRTAAVSYLTLGRAFASDLLGAYARTRLAALAGATLSASPVAGQMENIAAAVPDWLETMIGQPHRVVSVEALPERTDIRLLERTPIQIGVTNVSPIPLAVGPDKAINSRFLLAPVAEVLARPTAAGELVEVVSLDRRLRLLPRERFDATVWADGGQLGLLLDLAATGNTRVRWRIIEGFQLSGTQVYDAGPHSVSTDTPTLIRRPAARFLADVPSTIASIESGGPRELGEAILAVRARQMRVSEAPPLAPSEVEAFVEAVSTRFRKLDKPSKILVQCLMPTVAVQGQVAAFDAAASRDSDPDVVAVQMALRATSPDDPIFSSPAVDADPNLRRLATITRDRLRGTRRTFASQERDVRPPSPPVVGPPRPDPRANPDAR